MKFAATSPRRRKKRVLIRKKRTLDPSLMIDYKNPDVLKRFITDRGKIVPRRISGASQEQQKRLAVAIKRARFLSLLPYSIAHCTDRGFNGEIQNVVQTFVSSTMRGGPRGPGAGAPGSTGGAPGGPRMGGPRRQEREGGKEGFYEDKGDQE